jgi:hypothetical protein
MALAAPRILTCFEGPTSSFHSLFTIHTIKSKMSLYPLAALAAILSAASLDLLKTRTSLATWAARGLTNGESPQVGDQDQYIHVSSHWVQEKWEAQGRPMPGPTIVFNTSFGVVGLGGLHGVPASIVFPIADGGRSAPLTTTADAFTAILPLLLGGPAMLANSYYSSFQHSELEACRKSFNVTTVTGDGWMSPLLPIKPFDDAVRGSYTPIATLRSSDHRTFDVDAALCTSTVDVIKVDLAAQASGGPNVEDSSSCCGYYNPAQGNVLTPVVSPYPCRSLLFDGELYGFNYPRLDFVFECDSTLP